MAVGSGLALFRSGSEAGNEEAHRQAVEEWFYSSYLDGYFERLPVAGKEIRSSCLGTSWIIP